MKSMHSGVDHGFGFSALLTLGAQSVSPNGHRYVWHKQERGGVVELCYYFNPTPNARNLEFDGINNLFHPAWNDDSWPRQP